MNNFIKSLNIDWKLAIIIVSIIISAIIISKIIRWLITKAFDSDNEKIKVDPTRYKFFKNASSLIIWIVALGALTLQIPELRELAITLFAGAGIFMAIMGLAAQQAFSNIISGVLIVIFKPFRVGDMIQVGEAEYGVVEDITLRHTILTNFQNNRIIIPNSIIGTEKIVNNIIEDEKICKWIEVGISYDSDVDLAIQIIQEEATKHPKCISNLNQFQKEMEEPQVEVRLMSFGEYSINLRAYVWTNDAWNAMRMHSDINKAIKKRFDNEGIEIPFPYRTLVYKKDLPPNAKPH